MRTPRLTRALARALISGPQTFADTLARAEHCLGNEYRWLRPLVRRYIAQFERTPYVEHVELFIARSRFYRFALEKFGPALQVQNWITAEQKLRVERWQLPQLDSVPKLCHWLAIDLDHLEWLSDCKRYGYSTSNPKLENYTYHHLAKPGGSIRLIESPKKTLKELQRRILRDLLDRVPSHPAVHGFVPNRSIKTFAAPHTSKHVVLRMDLKNFFPGIHAARVAALFRTFGYSDSVAWYLTGLCTNAAPRRLWKDVHLEANAFHELWSLYARRHLPQGAPTSPAIANLCASQLDQRLITLATKSGATYTRYADDLAFSGDLQFSRRAERFSIHVAAIALEEGFTINHRKTRVMRQGVRQHLAGLTTNVYPNIRRSDFDQLKAILTNCIRHGLASQNRSTHPDFLQHLRGKVGFVAMINPQKGARLRALLSQITS